jgi:hypothetical protein
VPIPPLIVPPRPPELPTVPPPPPVDLPTDAVHLRNDSFLARWVEEFERVMKDAWFALSQIINGIEKRILALETRISDTYTFGQVGGLKEDSRIALPLLVVRDEKLAEWVVTLETPPSGESAVIELRRNETQVLATAVMNDEGTTVALDPQTPLLKNDKLEAWVVTPGVGAADIVCQARCV